eukprot:7935920-Lingulodinium_polyedra.AAC.1
MSASPASPLLPVPPAVSGLPNGRLTALRTPSHCSREKVLRGLAKLVRQGAAATGPAERSGSPAGEAGPGAALGQATAAAVEGGCT